MRQKLSDYRIFAREFRATFKHTGALLPSGAQLARSVTRPFKESEGPRRLLEVGPGTGAVTDRIVRLVRPGDHVTLVEVNEQFVDRLNRRFREEPRWQRVADQFDVVHASLLDFEAEEKFTSVISGMPMNNFEVSLARDLYEKLFTLVAPGATLSFFEYVAIRRIKSVVSQREERARLRKITEMLRGNLKNYGIGSDLILANVPPAWVHHIVPNADGVANGAGHNGNGATHGPHTNGANGSKQDTLSTN